MLHVSINGRTLVSRILIAGCGDIGSRLGALLSSDGHEVWGLRRSAAALPDPVRLIQADLTRSGDLEAIPEGIDAVVYTATPDSYDDRDYESAYVSGVATLMHALSGAGQVLRRFIFVSSTGVYGQDDGQWVDEVSPTAPGQFSGRRLLEGERLVLDAELPGLVVRFGGIYGPGRNRLLQRVRDGKPCQQTPPVYTNRIHRDDCVAVLHHLLMLDAPDPIYLGVDCEPSPQCEVMDWLASRMGVPRPPRKSAQSIDGARGSGKRCRNTRLVSSGYSFIYPSYRDGYAEILAG
jgi:nucleoside-diphosphate-sugar epimerase